MCVRSTKQQDTCLCVIDEYQGTVTLTADFADGTLKGCIGCAGDLVTRRAHFGAFFGEELIDPGATARDYELHLATAIIRRRQACSSATR